MKAYYSPTKHTTVKLQSLPEKQPQTQQLVEETPIQTNEKATVSLC